MPTLKGIAPDGSAIYEPRLPARGVDERLMHADYVGYLNRRYGTDFTEIGEDQWRVMMDVHDFARAVAEREWPKIYAARAKGAGRAVAAAVLSDSELASKVCARMRKRFAGPADHLSARTVRRLPEYEAAADAIASAERTLIRDGII